jgi:NAD(P)-dependent dehydrogenase (short-subunit alcohol dehydrogenase family)
MAQRIVITGSNSGFGLLMVQNFAKKGHTVFAAMRDVNGKNKAAAAELSQVANVTVVEMDVLNDASVDAAAAKIGAVDAAINNAGGFHMGHAESFTTAQVSQAFELNVVGSHRVARAFLPKMREQKRGVLVQLSSCLARLPMPFMGVYAATKAAVEVINESLKYELVGSGVDVCVVEPGPFDTGLMAKTVFGADQARIANYMTKDGPQQSGEAFGKMMAQPTFQRPQEVADAVVALVEMTGKRPLRTTVDKIGLGAAADAINATNSEAMKQVLNNMGMGAML